VDLHPERGVPRALLDHEEALAALAAADVDADRLLTALRLVGGLRSHLDDLERQLIEAARDRDASWSRIADCLGLATRQAAEQRWLRLSGQSTRDPMPVRTERQRQRFVDERYGHPVGRLRGAARAAHRALDAEPDWDRRDPRAALVRATIAMAASADPGALFDLARQAIADLDEMATDTSADIPALRRLREAVRSATPPRQS
jgi:hypothetical protein